MALQKRDNSIVEIVQYYRRQRMVLQEADNGIIGNYIIGDWQWYYKQCKYYRRQALVLYSEYKIIENNECYRKLRMVLQEADKIIEGKEQYYRRQRIVLQEVDNGLIERVQ